MKQKKYQKLLPFIKAPEFAATKKTERRKKSYENFEENNTALRTAPPQEEKIYSVGEFLDIVNQSLSQIRVGVRGEITSIDIRDSYLFFTLKDKKDESLISCFMWRKNYEVCGVELEEGTELTAYGKPEIYKRNGRFSLRAEMVELVGEGALKKAYEELREKLRAEGLFAKERKKPLPDYPCRIGLITSRDGAVINDFLNNIGRFGFKITFFDSRVEGIMAVKELIKAVRYFQKKPVDILVIIRGGGSLESLQAFNNESLIREVAKLPVPFICGIGHDKDVPLIYYVADKAVSTPSIVAKEINKSWERAISQMDFYEKTIFSRYAEILRKNNYKLDNVSLRIKEFYLEIFRKFDFYQQSIKNYILNTAHAVRHENYRIQRITQELLAKFKNGLNKTRDALDTAEKNIWQNDPTHQLKLGYSITTTNGKIVKSAEQVRKGDTLINRVYDGKIKSVVE